MPIRFSTWVAAVAWVVACGRAPTSAPGASAAPAATVHVSSEPAGAAIEVDGQALAQVTPADVTEPAYKEYKIRLTLPGYQPWSGSFVAIANAEPVRATFAPLLTVRVETDPPGARVSLDGKVVIESTPGTLQTGVGALSLRVEKEGYLPVQAAPSFNFANQAWKATLSPAAYVAVKSTPTGADLELDGLPTGLKTPIERMPVSAGAEHTLVAKAGELASAPRRIAKLKRGAVQSVTLSCIDTERVRLHAEVVRLQGKVTRLQVNRTALDRESRRYEYKDAVRFLTYQKRLEALDDQIADAREKAADVQRDLDAHTTSP